MGEEFPEQHEDGLADGDGPDRAVEVAALRAFAEGGGFDAREFGEGPEEKD